MVLAAHRDCWARQAGQRFAQELRRAGYRISEIISRGSSASRPKARALAKKVGAFVASTKPRLDADLVWICVPDREIVEHGVSWCR